MPPERIGLEAVMDMAGFNRGIAQYVRGVGKIERFSGLAASQFSKLGLAVVGVTAAIGAAVIAYKALAAVTRLTVDLAVSSTKAAISVESAFAGVVKTTDGLVDDFGNLNAVGEETKQLFRDLALEVPLAVEELMAIGEVGGQLGIAREDLIEFTETVAALGVTTNLSAQEAAFSLARLSTIMKLSAEDFSRMASAVVELGNKMGVTESSILNLSVRVATASAIVGITAPQLLGMAAAVAKVGIQAEAGGTALMTALFNIERFVNKGGAQLELLALVAGTTVGEFKRLWVEDAAEAMSLFVEGLGRAGKDAQAVLEQLELGNVRTTRTLLSLATAGEVFREGIAMSVEAAQADIAAQREAELRYATTAAQLQILNNTVRDAKVALADELLPILGGYLLPLLNELLKEHLVPLAREFGEKLPQMIVNLALSFLRFGRDFGHETEQMIYHLQQFGEVIRLFVEVAGLAWGLFVDALWIAATNAGKIFDWLTQMVDIALLAMSLIAEKRLAEAALVMQIGLSAPVEWAENNIPGRMRVLSAYAINEYRRITARAAPHLVDDYYQMGVSSLAAFQAGLAGARKPTPTLRGVISAAAAAAAAGRPAGGVAPPTIPALPGAAGIPGLAELLAEMESESRKRGTKIGKNIQVPLESALEAAVRLGQTFAQVGSAFSRVIEERYIGPMAEFLEKTEGAVAALGLPEGALLPFLYIPGMAELLNARAKATERVAEAEAKILALQEQQAQLDFLGQQVKLLELIQAHGLDVAEVLGEMTLGLEADPLMLVEAMTRAVNRIVTQTQAELVALGGVTPAGTAGGQVFQSSTEANFGPINIYDTMDLEALRSLVMQWVTEE